MVGVERVVASGCTLGEGPAWDQRRGCLWFVDIKGHLVHRFDPASGAHSTLTAPDQVGWVLPARDGRLLAGVRTGLHALDPDSGSWHHLGPIAGEPAGNRLNDACIGPGGAVYFGSMDDGETAATGRFYRFAQGKVEACGPDGICITNGPATSPDGTAIYFADTVRKHILKAALDAHGRPGHAELLVDTADTFPEAYPDGPVCDALGYIWTGLWNGWGVARYDPAGRLVQKVDLPVANVTKLAFGGADLRRVFVTTARKGLGPAELAAQPMAGDVFAFDSEVPGLPDRTVELG